MAASRHNWTDTKRPLHFYFETRGAAFLDRVVETFARLGTIEGARAELGIGKDSLTAFLVRVVGIPAPNHGGARPGTRRAWKNPGAEIALAQWNGKRAMILSAYASRSGERYSDAEVLAAFGRAGSKAGAARILGASEAQIGKRLRAMEVTG